jgi:predicted enzyme related to lactoylglutathione lyase
VFRPGSVSYLRIPAPDPGALAPFYRDVFGWSLHGNPAQPGFTDLSGHVIGHFLPDLEVAGEAGFRPYIYVERLDETLAAVVAAGGGVGALPRGRPLGGHGAGPGGERRRPLAARPARLRRARRASSRASVEPE